MNKPPLTIPTFTIMKNVPMPKPSPEMGTGKLALQMEVGDSIAVPYARRPFASNMERACRNAGLVRTFSQRRIRDEEAGTDLIHIWRIT